MAWLGIVIIIYMDTQDHATYRVWIHFIPTSLYPRREKTIWSELELKPGPLASQATALTTRPLLLGQEVERCLVKSSDYFFGGTQLLCFALMAWVPSMTEESTNVQKASCHITWAANDQCERLKNY